MAEHHQVVIANKYLEIEVVNPFWLFGIIPECMFLWLTNQMIITNLDVYVFVVAMSIRG